MSLIETYTGQLVVNRGFDPISPSICGVLETLDKASLDPFSQFAL